MSTRFLKVHADPGHLANFTGEEKMYLNVFDIDEVHDREEKYKDGTRWVTELIHYMEPSQSRRYYIYNVKATEVMADIERRIHCEMDYARLGKASLVPETPEKPEKKDTE